MVPRATTRSGYSWRTTLVLWQVYQMTPLEAQMVPLVLPLPDRPTRPETRRLDNLTPMLPRQTVLLVLPMAYPLTRVVLRPVYLVAQQKYQVLQVAPLTWPQR